MASELFVIIPAAGESRRYREAGYTIPKPLLLVEPPEAMARIMVDHVIYSSGMQGRANVLVGLPEGRTLPWTSPARVIPISHTRGQADTIYQMLQTLSAYDSVLVLDCDMVLRVEDNLRIVKLLDLYDVVVAVTSTLDPNASRVDRVPHPTLFVEKQPISTWGMVGARAFSHVGQLRDALKTVLDSSLTTENEPYLSSAINFCAGTKYAYRIEDFYDWGTPERLKQSGAKIIGGWGG